MDEHWAEWPDSIQLPLGLHRTRLHVVNGELVRTSARGDVTMRLPLDSIRSVGFHRQIDPTTIGFFMMGLGAAGLGYYNLTTPLLATAFFGLAIVLVSLSSFALRYNCITVRTGQATIPISCADLTDECIGFVATLQAMIGGEET